MSRTNKKIPYGFHSIDDSDIQAVVDILENSAIAQGQTVEDFGQALVDYTGVKYGAGSFQWYGCPTDLSSGTE